MPTFELSANGKTFEIDAPDQGAAFSAFQKMQGDQPSTTMDVAKSAVSGLGKGTAGLLGSVGDITDLGAKGLETASDYVSDKLGIEKYKRPEKPSVLNNIPGAKDVQKAVEDNVTGKFYEPQTTAGKYAHSAAEFIPSSLIGPGGIGAKIMTGATAGLGSEAAGQATEGTKAEPYARVAGALAGGLAPMAAGRAVTPLPASAARQRLVDVLQDEGVTSLTAGQRTGNKALQYAEDFIGNAPGAGQGANNIRQRGQEQFTEAAMRRAGAGPDASPEILAQNNARLGNEFERLSAQNTLTPDNQMITDLTDAVRRYRNIPNSQQAQMLQGYLDDIIPHINAGGMPGVEYQPMRSMLSTDSKAVRMTDPYLSRALAGIRDSLDDAMGRSISPADRDAWAAARRQYGAQKTIEKTASRAGEATAEGQLVPANLRNTVSADNRGAYARGEGDFSELARAGSAVMAPLPNSGTAQRLNLNNIAMLPVSATIGRLMTSRPAQAYLGNQALTRQLQNLPPRQQAILTALMGADKQQLLSGPSN